MVKKRGKIIKLIAVLLVFIFAFLLRIWNIDRMGRTWDEGAYVEMGYKFVQLAKKGDFSNPYWYKTSDAPPLARYAYGLIGQLDIDHFLESGDAVFRYNLTASRILSAFVSSLSAVIVLLIGWEFISIFVGVAGAIIFMMLPFFLGLSQLATLESFTMLFFTSSIYVFLHFLKDFSIKKMFLSGILVGIALTTKYTNVLLMPLMTFVYLWYFKSANKKVSLRFTIKVLCIFLISIVVFFLLWPMPWVHLREVFDVNYKWRVIGSRQSVPEVFFGRLMLVPIFYYFVHFLITTPLVILGFFMIGIKYIFKNKKWILYVLLVWFLFPFILSFYNFRQHGVRYIIQVYAPLSLIAAIGIDYFFSKFTSKITTKLLYFVPIIIYLFIILVRITPYYLDYFNILVGGAKGVYEKKLFQLGWWGQGIGESAEYLSKNAAKGSKIGLAISPLVVMPHLSNQDMSRYQEGINYDYVIVNYFNIVREGFNDYEIKKNYIPVYFVLADGAKIVTVYKHK